MLTRACLTCNRGFSSCSSPLKPCRCGGKSPVIQRRSLCLGYDVMHNSVHNHSITLLIFALLKEQPPPRFLALTTTQRAYLSTCDFLRVARILVWWNFNDAIFSLVFLSFHFGKQPITTWCPGIETFLDRWQGKFGYISDCPLSLHPRMPNPIEGTMTVCSHDPSKHACA